MVKKPTYHTQHKSLSLKDLRSLFHGVSATAVVSFEVAGELYEPVGMITEQSDVAILKLEKKRE